MTEFRDGIFFWKIFKIFRHGIIHHKLIRIDQEHVKENSQESILARWSFMTTSQELAWSYHLIGLTKIIWAPFFVLTWLDRYRLGGMGHKSSNFLFFIENYLWINGLDLNRESRFEPSTFVAESLQIEFWSYPLSHLLLL